MPDKAFDGLPDGFSCRPMTVDDVSVVAGIEALCQLTPWSEQLFYECLHHDYYCDLVECGSTPVAFQIVSRVLDEAHLLNIAVSPAWRRRGIARALLHKAMNRARAEGAVALYLELRASNEDALKLYEALGFEQTGFRKDYYRTETGREDALLMMRQLGGD